MKEKNYLLGGLAIGLLIIMAAGLAITAGFLAYRPDGMAQGNTITVTGNSEKEVAPDEVELYLSVQTEGKTSAEVQQFNTQKTNKIIEELTALGLERSKIETTQYNLYPKQNYDEKTGESSIYGYTLSHTLKITTDDIENVGKYADAGVKAGANSIQGINFKLKTATEKAIREELLAKAASDARGKAESIAKGLGSKLGSVLGASENQVYFPMFRNSVMMAKEAYGTADSAPLPPDIMPTNEKVTAQVSVVYKVK